MSFHYHDNDNFIVGCVGGNCPIKLPQVVSKEVSTKKGKKKKMFVEMVEQNVNLPPLETTDLKNLIDSGAPLQKVSPLMFDDMSTVHNLESMINYEIAKNNEQLIDDSNKSPAAPAAPAAN